MHQQTLREKLPAIALGIIIMLMAATGLVWAKSSAPAPAPLLEKVRVHADQNTFRIVLELTAIPAYTVSVIETPHQVEVDLPDTLNRSNVSQLSFVDPFIDKLRFVDLGGGQFKAVVSLKMAVLPKASLLSSPPRLVIDLLKNYQSRSEYVIAPGLIYREFLTGRSAGPVKAHVLEVDLKAGYALRPVLSND